MILDHTPLQGVTLVDVDNFSAFKLRLRDATQRRPQIGGVNFVDDDNVLVDIALVPTLPGARQTSDWQAGYETMIARSTKGGWIDIERSAIRAHVERLS